MKIKVAALNGQKITLQVEPVEKIWSVISKISHDGLLSRRPDNFRLIYGGKHLSEDQTVDYYNIREGATLHLVERLPGDVTKTPFQPALTTTASALAGLMKSHNDEGVDSISCDYDEDLHIVDPQAHFRSIKMLERHVVERSEYFTTGRIYDASTTLDVINGDTLRKEQPWLKSKLQAQISQAMHDRFGDLTRSPALDVLGHLLKTISITQGALDSFKQMAAKGFCSDSFNILLQHGNIDVIQIKRIASTSIGDLANELYATLCDLLEHPDVIFHGKSMENTLPPCQRLLQNVDVDVYMANFGSGSSDVFAKLTLVRQSALFLDIALVSYARSHGSGFDIGYFGTEMDSLKLNENDHCTYKISDFMQDWASDMTILGTQDSFWKTDSRTLAVGLSKYIGVTISGSQKLIPETTRKQHILDKWTTNPMRANPGILNQHLGIQVSHCTGNARRISLRELMTTEPIWSVLERQSPGWTQTPWGAGLSRALRGHSDENVFFVWKVFASERENIAELVCCMLELLDRTGWLDDQESRAALLFNNEESAVSIPNSINNWSIALQDTHLTSAYVVVHEVCLNCLVPDHSTSSCHIANAFTVLQTQIAIDSMDESGSGNDCYQLKPFKRHLKPVYDAGSADTKEFLRFSSRFPLIGMIPQARGCIEVFNRIPSSGTTIYIRASTRSFHGKYKPLPPNPKDFGIADQDLRGPSTYCHHSSSHVGKDSAGKRKQRHASSERGDHHANTEQDSRDAQLVRAVRLQRRDSPTKFVSRMVKLFRSRPIHHMTIGEPQLVAASTETNLADLPGAFHRSLPALPNHEDGDGRRSSIVQDDYHYVSMSGNLMNDLENYDSSDDVIFYNEETTFVSTSDDQDSSLASHHSSRPENGAAALRVNMVF